MNSRDELFHRGKEICFCKHYFYPWLDKVFPDLDLTWCRRVALSIATLAKCDPKAVTDIIEAKFISTDPKKDLRWKTEHNIYPRDIHKHEETICMHTAQCPTVKTTRINLLNLYTKWKEYDNYINDPVVKYRGKEVDCSPVFRKEHWEAMEAIMLLLDHTVTITPISGWWNYQEV